MHQVRAPRVQRFRIDRKRDVLGPRGTVWRDDAAGRWKRLGRRASLEEQQDARRIDAQGDEPRRVERPVRTLSATIVAKPRRARIAIARPARAVRFTSSYYGQYAQSTEQSYTSSYGYGEGDAADQQPVVRYLVRPRVARPAASTVNSAVGGPFVKARTP